MTKQILEDLSATTDPSTFCANLRTFVEKVLNKKGSVSTSDFLISIFNHIMEIEDITGKSSKQMAKLSHILYHVSNLNTSNILEKNMILLKHEKYKFSLIREAFK